MHFSTASLLAALSASVATAKQQMQINYYSDVCTSYLGHTDVTWATALYGGPDNCYNYRFGEFANIANCYEPRCLCNFFTGKDCGGDVIAQASHSGDCVQVRNTQSFACYYD